jgi:hypothetical protein
VGKFPNTVSGLIQWALLTVEAWCDELGLLVNLDKTGLIAFTKRRKFPGFFEPRLLGVTLQCSKSVKYLGVILDSWLTWKEHVDVKARKAKNLLWACRRAYGGAWGLGPKVVHWLYVCLIRPSVTYASLVWWTGCQMASAKKKLKQNPKISMLTNNRGNAYTNQRNGSSYLPPSTRVNGAEGGQANCTSSLKSGMLVLPASQ